MPLFVLRHAFRIDEIISLFLVLFQADAVDLVETVLLENFRRPPGARSAVSSDDDENVPGDLREACFELGDGDVDVAGDGAEFLDFAAFANVEEKELHLLGEQPFEFIGRDVLGLRCGGVLGRATGKGERGEKETSRHNPRVTRDFLE